ncbi:M23 family metallopeptidase [Microbacterium pullorum]|uniref:M23 family metallopeptidase n=1 Tax=Microbacterium pullorum TaxID=2762236 RepID=UPI001CD8CCCD|nr:M23 family metallopeptidase [Microbacterium pullorum]
MTEQNSATPAATRRAARAAARDAARAVTPRVTVRSAFAIAVVVSLAGTVALPAVAYPGTEGTTTAAQPAVPGTATDAATSAAAAADTRETQSLVVASAADGVALDRASYAATTPEELASIEQAKAEAERARLAAAITNGQLSSISSALPIVGAGGVTRPLPYFNNFGTPYAGHKGVDYMVAAGTPIYAIADGIVIESSESGPGWGVYVRVAHNINGTSVTTLYAHMTYGTRTVQVGDRVTAGQVIGQVGATGRAFGTHLHLEVQVNNSYVNGESWLVANGL